ncbi:acetyltransferase [Vibrio cholerae]|nr:acetyltransferase [Vibrio cholerae]
MVMVIVIEFGGMRCQPLRRALAVSEKAWKFRLLHR